MGGLSERRVPTFTAQSSTAELMQTIIHLREMNNKLHFSAELEKAQFEKDLEYMTDQLRVEHRREVLKLEEEVDRLRKELIGYQNTSGDTLKLLSSLWQENEELTDALQAQQSRFSETQTKLQATVQKMEKFMDEAAARETSSSDLIAKLQAELAEAQNQNMSAKQHHLAETQKLLDGFAELRSEHAKERSADREVFQKAQSEWRMREAQLLSDLAKAEEAVATLSVCFEDALDTTEAVLRRKGSALPCPICQAGTRPMPSTE
jgi:chromosome segregation ATPase